MMSMMPRADRISAIANADELYQLVKAATDKCDELHGKVTGPASGVCGRLRKILVNTVDLSGQLRTRIDPSPICETEGARYVQTKYIAKALGCSDDTVRRWYREGKLKGAFKIGGDTSPIKMSRRNLAKMVRKMTGEV